MNGQCCPSDAPTLSEELSSTPTRLPSIPEGEPLVSLDDAMCESIQARRRTQSEDEESWSQGELQKALQILMRSEYVAPFVDAQSSSGMSLQVIEQSIQCGRYVNELDLFWSDVESCWDTCADICNAECKVAHKERSSAFIKRFYMANKMRALTSELEMNFWNSLFTLQQHLPNEGTHPDACGKGGPGEMEASWVMDTAADLVEWMFSSELVKEM